MNSFAYLIRVGHAALSHGSKWGKCGARGGAGWRFAGSSPASVADAAEVVPVYLHALRFAALGRTRAGGDPALVAAGFKGS